MPSSARIPYLAKTTEYNFGKIAKKYSGHIPIVVNAEEGTSFKLKKGKYIVLGDMSFMRLAYLIRKNIKLEESKAVFFLIHGKIIPNHLTIAEIKAQYEKESNGLYIDICEESTFG